MKLLFLGLIHLYWNIIPKSIRGKCIFRESCSKHVHRITRDEGFKDGLNALFFRYKNCRTKTMIFKNPMTNEIQLILPSEKILNEEEVSEKLIETFK
ncbi:membrane protein insertion efficiency factor YidD [uncultured Croceitalea sp.]|uniref:membrane protein insertion efficiency factor YidD n=1 Tax=uncultured Croceitalea sp. TaxID=1798908 RepID=UPI00374F312D